MAIDMSKKRPAPSASAAAKTSPNKKPKYDGAKPKPDGAKASTNRKPKYDGSKPKADAAKKPPSKFKPKSAVAGGSSKPHSSGGAGAKKPYPNKFSKPSAGGDAAGSSNPFEKQDWNKFKKDKKELKLKRKQGDNKDLFELTVEGKKVYEELRCKSTNNKEELATKLFALLRGADNFQKLVLAHDTARIVQCLLKYAPAETRTEIAEYLVTKVPEMAISKYAHFCVLRIIKYGTADIKAKVVDAMLGHVMRLANNKYASTILDTIYVSWASSQQKAYLRQEWYGDLYKTSKDAAVKQISDTYAESPHIKLAIVNAVKANLEHVVNKKLIDNGLVHAVLLEYLTVCSEEERIEMAVSYNPYIPSLASTKDGARAAMVIFFNSIVKDRRSIVKSLREHLIKLCTHEHGHVLILAVINSMDDTKALKKSIFDHIFAHIEYIAANEWGRRIVEWFVAPDDRTLFHPQIIGYLEAGLLNSKKDKEVRRAEIVEAVEEPLCEAIAANPAFWLRGGHTGLATAAILRRAAGAERVRPAYEKLAELIVQPGWQVAVKEVGEKEPSEVAAVRKPKANAKVKVAVDGEEGTDAAAAAAAAAKKKKIIPKILKKYKSPFEKEKTAEPAVEQIAGIEHAGLHIVLKKILKSDGERSAAETETATLGAALVDKLNAETVKQWIPLNRAAFLLLVTYETGTQATCDKLRTLLKPTASLLRKQSHTAAKLLIKKLEL